MKNENMAFMMLILQKYYYLYHKMPNFYVLTQHPFIKYHKIIKKATVIYTVDSVCVLVKGRFWIVGF